MTHEQVVRHWDAIVAFKEGKPIEMREPGKINWYPTPAPEFLPDWEYRERRSDANHADSLSRWFKHELDITLSRYELREVVARVRRFEGAGE